MSLSYSDRRTEIWFFDEAKFVRSIIDHCRADHPVKFSLQTVMLEMQPEVFAALFLHLGKEILGCVDVSDVQREQDGDADD